MRILYLSTSFPRWQGDGFVNFLYELARGLSRNAELTVLTPNFPGGKTDETFGGFRVKRFNYFLPRRSQRVLYPEGIPTQLKKSRLARCQAPFFMFSFWIHAIREARRADVILCNWALTGYIVQKARWFVRRPYVVIVRGSDLAMIEKGGFFARLFLGALRRADAVCAVSEAFVDALQERGISPVFFTPNGTEYDRFGGDRQEARAKLGLDDRPMVLFVGSLVERKGVTLLLEAMRGLDARLVYVGDGNQQEALAEQAKRDGVDVMFAGRRPAGDLASWYAASDVFVLPSFFEGRPNVLIEAMASGRACIATDIPGSRELIGDEGGVLVPSGDVAALREALQRVLGDRELRERLERAGQERVRSVVPSWAESAANYRALLERVVST